LGLVENESDANHDESILHVSNDQQHRVLNLRPNQRWKERLSGRVIIPYSVSSSFSSDEKVTIRNALDDLESRTGSVSFVPRSNEGHYIAVVRLEDTCHSDVGKIGGPQQLNLGTGCMSFGEWVVSCSAIY
jgi:hypothetical protein